MALLKVTIYHASINIIIHSNEDICMRIKINKDSIIVHNNQICDCLFCLFIMIHKSYSEWTE